MRVTLDWDEPKDRAENEDAAKRISGDWQLRRSSGGTGYHFIAYDAVNSTPQTYENLIGVGTSGPGIRERLGDDEKRVSLDRKRWDMGSPFQQVLYSRKYMARGDRPPYTTGNTSEYIAGVKHVEDDDRIKDDDGRLDYHKIARLLAREYGTKAALARKMDVSTSTVSRWTRDTTSGISEGNQKGLRRKARSQGIGHYVRTDEGGKSLDEVDGGGVHYTDAEDTRRTLVEYIDAPWSDDMDDPDREYRLCQVETGTFNRNHSAGQLRFAHEKAVETVIDRLSPTSPKNGVTLNLDRDLRSDWNDSGLRNPDSVHYEAEILDPGETDVYVGNLPRQSRINGPPEDHIITEVILWDSLGGSVEWHVILVDDGDGWSNHTVLTDDRGWW